MAGTPEQHIYMLRGQLTESTRLLQDEQGRTNQLQSDNKKLEALINTQKKDVLKLTLHAKKCEAATAKAQKEAKHAKGGADHAVNSQKGQLKSAERRYEETARELRQWKDKYGESVDTPAEEKHALQQSVADLQSKAEETRSEIASLEAQIQGTPEQVGLHQALEEWEEHQKCSEGFAELEDQVHDAKIRQQKLESDLTASRQHCQKVKSDLKALQSKQAEQLKQNNDSTQDQNKVDEYIRYTQQLESDLRVSRDQHQQKDAEFSVLRANATLLEQTNKAMRDQDKTSEYAQYIQQLKSDLEASKTQHEQTKTELEVLQQKASQLQAESDVTMVDDDMLRRMQLQTDLKTHQEQLRKAESNMETLQKKADDLEQANIALQEQDKSRQNSSQKLELDLQASRDQCQQLESNLQAGKDRCQQLESDLTSLRQENQTSATDIEALKKGVDELDAFYKTASAQRETAQVNMKAIQDKANQLESDLSMKEQQYQTSISNTGALQGKIDRLESSLDFAKVQFNTAASDLKTIKAKADELEQANKVYQEKDMERLQAKTSKKVELDQNGNDGAAGALQQDEGRMKSVDVETSSMKPEQDTKTQQPRAGRSQVSSFTHILEPSTFLFHLAYNPC